MKAPPSSYPPAPYNRADAETSIPLHCRYLTDGVGRKWHWVNSLRKGDEELAADLHRGAGNLRALSYDVAPAASSTSTAFSPEISDHSGVLWHDGTTRWDRGSAAGSQGLPFAACWATRPQLVTVQNHQRSDHPPALPLYIRSWGFTVGSQSRETIRPMSFEGERQRDTLMISACVPEPRSCPSGTLLPISQ